MRPVEAKTSVQEMPEPLVLRLEGMSRLGEAIAHHDGKPVYVFGGIPGELVEVAVLRVRRRYIAARVTSVLEPSPHRVAAPCPYFDPCTGCQWQHIAYEHQLELKRHMVQEELQRVAGFTEAPVSATLPSPVVWGYRNHARFTVGPQGRLGFMGRETRRFVDVEQCLIMHPRINEMLGQLQGRCGETTQVAIRYGMNTGAFLVQPTLQNPEIQLATGQKAYSEALRGRRFRVASPSFFQVNVPQAEQMVDMVRDRLRLTGEETLVDAYSGVGTFAALLAPYVKRVVAIEESRAAAQDALENFQGVANVELCQGKAEEVLAKLAEAPDVLILDPPRAGCQPPTLKAVKRLRPKRVVYVSCEPVTLARDLRVLCDGTYRLEEIQPVDMFPHTHHIECIATLSLEVGLVEGDGPLLLASSSPRRREILGDLGLVVQAVEPDIVEAPPGEVAPEEYVQRLALAKAQQVAQGRQEGVVIGGDTVVVDGGEVLGKPRRPAEAEAMLQRLRGRRHRVLTGLAVVNTATGQSATTFETSQITMRSYSETELQRYVGSGGAIGKAGAYGIQDETFHPAEALEGCYLNVVGLPVCALLQLLRQVGVTVTPRKDWQPPEQCHDCPLRQREGTP